MTKNASPIIVESKFTAHSDALWKAISDHSTMKKWFFDNIPSFEAKEGFEVVFKINSTKWTFTHILKVIEVVPQKKVVLSWKYEEFGGEGKVTFEIEGSGENSSFRLRNEGLESFPQDIPEFQRSSCEEGWNFFINERLMELVTPSTSQGN